MPVTLTHKKKQPDGSYVQVSTEYVQVKERVLAFHADRNGAQIHVETWPVSEDERQVTMGAKVTTPAGTFTGHARSHKDAGNIEGQSPMEVAETSAVGRALAFAGYGIEESIASVEEVKAAQSRKPNKQVTANDLWAYMKKHQITHIGVLKKLGADTSLVATRDDAITAILQYAADLVDMQHMSESDAFDVILKEIQS